MVDMIPAQAAETLKADALSQAQARLERLEQQFATAQTATAQELKTLRKEIISVRSTAQDCVQGVEPRIKTLNSEIAIFQPENAKGTQAKSAQETQPEAQLQVPSSPVYS